MPSRQEWIIHPDADVFYGPEGRRVVLGQPYLDGCDCNGCENIREAIQALPGDLCLRLVPSPSPGRLRYILQRWDGTLDPPLFQDGRVFPEDEDGAPYPDDDLDDDSDYYPDDDDPDSDYYDREAVHLEVNVADAPAPKATPALLVPDLAKRDARLISFEQEVSYGASRIAKAMYRDGFAEEDYVHDYHSGVGGMVRVETDASCGGEVIYSKLDLSVREEARKFEKALTIVKDLVLEGKAGVDYHCGGHIHVDASGLELRHLFNLYTVWNYLERPLFRIGAANWGTHRIDEIGDDYVSPTQKGLDTRYGLWRHMGQSRGALNMSNYVYARGNCDCEAGRLGAWADCSCEMRKATIEFRVWNSTVNLRKVHAYAALSVAMVEYARRHDILNPVDFPINSYEYSYQLGGRGKVALQGDPYGFILSELTLTAAEREDVKYCIDNMPTL